VNNVILFQGDTNLLQFYTLESETRGDVTNGVVWAALLCSQFSPPDCGFRGALHCPNDVKTFSTGNEVFCEIDIVPIAFC
jgi:hypothetical protein